MTTSLGDALSDVRRAYRLLADYQQRLFELLGYMRERLGATAYFQDYVFGRPGNVSGLENDEFAGWRYLPCFDLSVIWLKHGNQEAPWDTHRAGDQMFGAWIRSDTGFDKYSGRFVDEPIDEARSELVLSVVMCDTPAPAPCNWYNRVWCGIPYPPDGTVGHSDAVPGYRCYAKAIALEALADQVAVDRAIDDWCDAASEALGVPVGSTRKGHAVGVPIA